MVNYFEWGTSELVQRIKEYEALKRCPMCTDGTLEKRSQEPLKDFDINKPERPHHEGHHAYVCDLCPFIGFEYQNPLDIEALKKVIK